MSVSESPGLPKSAVAPSSSHAGPFRENRCGPHQAIGTVNTRASLCISPSGLCNMIPRGSGSPQHFREKCDGCPVSHNLASGYPEKEILTDQGTAFIRYVTRALRIIEH